MRYCLAMLLLLPSAVMGQSVKMPERLAVDVKSLVGPIEVEIDGTLADFQLLRPNPADAVVFQVVAPAGKYFFVFQANQPGTYYLLMTAAKAGKFKNGFTVIVAGQPTPIPPGPGPGPAPPVPGQGFRALIIYESESLSKYPSGQVAAMKAKAVVDYLQARCARENGRPAWRVWDKDTDVAGESKNWQDAMKRPRLSMPWLIVSNDTASFEGPLPSTTEALLALLTKYGG